MGMRPVGASSRISKKGLRCGVEGGTRIGFVRWNRHSKSEAPYCAGRKKRNESVHSYGTWISGPSDAPLCPTDTPDSSRIR